GRAGWRAGGRGLSAGSGDTARPRVQVVVGDLVEGGRGEQGQRRGDGELHTEARPAVDEFGEPVAHPVPVRGRALRPELLQHPLPVVGAANTSALRVRAPSLCSSTATRLFWASISRRSALRRCACYSGPRE